VILTLSYIAYPLALLALLVARLFSAPIVVFYRQHSEEHHDVAQIARLCKYCSRGVVLVERVERVRRMLSEHYLLRPWIDAATSIRDSVLHIWEVSKAVWHLGVVISRNEDISGRRQSMVRPATQHTMSLSLSRSRATSLQHATASQVYHAALGEGNRLDDCLIVLDTPKRATGNGRASTACCAARTRVSVARTVHTMFHIVTPASRARQSECVLLWISTCKASSRTMGSETFSLTRAHPDLHPWAFRMKSAAM
jgi:hypothetical protein